MSWLANVSYICCKVSYHLLFHRTSKLAIKRSSMTFRIHHLQCALAFQHHRYKGMHESMNNKAYHCLNQVIINSNISRLLLFVLNPVHLISNNIVQDIQTKQVSPCGVVLRHIAKAKQVAYLVHLALIIMSTDKCMLKNEGTCGANLLQGKHNYSNISSHCPPSFNSQNMNFPNNSSKCTKISLTLSISLPFQHQWYCRPHNAIAYLCT